MPVLCYHHKGGVGKSTTAAHVALTLLDDGPVLVIDGDTQAHACAFFGVAAARAEDAPVEVLGAGAHRLFVAHAEHKALRQLPRIVSATHVVVDLSADFEKMARVATTLRPDLVLVCTKPHTGSTRDLADVVTALVRETAAGVRIVPIGMAVAQIHATLAAFPASAYTVMPPVSYVPDDADRSFEERRPLWDLPGHAAMRAEYDALRNCLGNEKEAVTAPLRGAARVSGRGAVGHRDAKPPPRPAAGPRSGPGLPGGFTRPLGGCWLFPKQFLTDS